MKLSDHILRKPFYVAFGTAQQGGGITSVDLVATRNATAITLTASDGSAAPIAGADANTAGVMTAADKSRLDSLPTVTARDLATKLDVATAMIGAGITHLRTSGHLTAGDGGGALYKRAGAEPAHSLKIQSADLAWWEIAPLNNVIPFQACGGIEGNSAANGAANVAAFDAFIGYAQLVFPGANDAQFASGPILLFPKGDYHFNTHLNVKATIKMEGAGTFSVNGGRAAAVLHFPLNSHGIIIHDETTIDEIVEASTFSGISTIISGLELVGGGNTGTAGHGIWSHVTAKVFGCRIRNFALDGIHIEANSLAADISRGNANLWVIDGASCARNGRHGVFVDGTDSNAGIGTNVDATLNGRWGIFDSSFLGNTWNACHASANGIPAGGGNTPIQSSFVSFGGNRYIAKLGATQAQLAATTPGTDPTIWIFKEAGGVTGSAVLWVAAQPTGTYFTGGPYATDNVNATSVFTGCYREDDQGFAQINRPSMVIGGFMRKNAGTGFTIMGASSGGAGRISGITTFLNSETFPETAQRTLDMTLNASDGRLIRIDPGAASGFMNLVTWEEIDDVWVIGEVDNQSNQRPIIITSKTTTGNTGGLSGGIPQGNVNFGNGIWLGSERWNTRKMTNGTAAPTTGEHAKGEIVWNRTMVAGGVIGWVCVATGTPGTWVEMRGLANQTSGANQTALTNSTGGVRDGTISAVGDTSTIDQSAVINNNLTELHTLLNEIRTTLVNFGLMKGGV